MEIWNQRVGAGQSGRQANRCRGLGRQLFEMGGDGGGNMSGLRRRSQWLSPVRRMKAESMREPA